MRILIVDDHSVVRQGLKRILSSDARFTVEEASSGGAALSEIRDKTWSLIFLDLSLPDRNGLDVLKQIKEQRPSLPVLILSMHADEEYAVRAIRAGAAGYLTKDSAPEEMLAAVDRVLAGGRYIMPALAEKIALGAAEGRTGAAHERLSDRELQVLLLIASGKTVSEIAAQLFLSVKTVSTHRAHILQKMGLRNNAELMHYAMRHALSA
jgi:two-component system invasion response regulator UvrY